VWLSSGASDESGTSRRHRHRSSRGLRGVYAPAVWGRWPPPLRRKFLGTMRLRATGRVLLRHLLSPRNESPRFESGRRLHIGTDKSPSISADSRAACPHQRNQANFRRVSHSPGGVSRSPRRRLVSLSSTGGDPSRGLSTRSAGSASELQAGREDAITVSTPCGRAKELMDVRASRGRHQGSGDGAA
jgi:hypothetical protein